jgi:hypothetical protein
MKLIEFLANILLKEICYLEITDMNSLMKILLDHPSMDNWYYQVSADTTGKKESFSEKQKISDTNKAQLMAPPNKIVRLFDGCGNCMQFIINQE